MSTSGDPDVVLYPDSGKVFAGERRTGGAGFGAVFRVDDSVDYYEGEEPPGR